MQKPNRAFLAPVVSAAPLARAGLANELIQMAKAYLLSEALGIPLVPSAWGLDRRPYWRYFSASRLDVVAYAARLALRRRLSFTELDYREAGASDYGQAARAWFEAQGNPAQRTVAISQGMWGGFVAIDAARTFVRRYLADSRHAARNIAKTRARRRTGTLLAAVHLRGGDFEAPPSIAEYHGSWNVALPLDWYASVCRGLRDLLGDSVQFLLVGDTVAGAARDLADELGALTTAGESHTDVSDLVLLSTADVLVCSISSYSLLAAWLGDSPYIWPREQLHSENGWLSLWGDEPAQRSGLTARNIHELSETLEAPIARGVPVPLTGVLPEELSLALSRGGAGWDRRADLLYYGVVRALQSS